jgi:hypothetical protein
MAYDESLSQRIGELIKGKTGFTSKEMFRGIAYLLNGNMCVGVHKNELIIRYDPEKTAEIKTDKNIHSFDMTGRSMKGWSLVTSEGVKGDGLKKWFDLSFSFSKSLPPKK